MGDGANDLPMMAAAGLSVAYHAKPKVRAQAQVAIDPGGLDRLLEVVRSLNRSPAGTTGSFFRCPERAFRPAPPRSGRTESGPARRTIASVQGRSGCSS